MPGSSCLYNFSISNDLMMFLIQPQCSLCFLRNTQNCIQLYSPSRRPVTGGLLVVSERRERGPWDQARSGTEARRIFNVVLFNRTNRPLTPPPQTQGATHDKKGRQGSKSVSSWPDRGLVRTFRHPGLQDEFESRSVDW